MLSPIPSEPAKIEPCTATHRLTNKLNAILRADMDKEKKVKQVNALLRLNKTAEVE